MVDGWVVGQLGSPEAALAFLQVFGAGIGVKGMDDNIVFEAEIAVEVVADHIAAVVDQNIVEAAAVGQNIVVVGMVAEVVEVQDAGHIEGIATLNADCPRYYYYESQLILVNEHY